MGVTGCGTFRSEGRSGSCEGQEIGLRDLLPTFKGHQMSSELSLGFQS